MKDNKNQLRNIRVLKRNMIFVQSYDDQIAPSTLNNQDTYSLCGEVLNLKTKQNYKNVTSYVTFRDPQAAAAALIAFYHLGSRMKVLFGTVQYCKYFMRKAECRNDYCVFLHVRDKKNQIIVNDQISETVYQEHYDMAVELAQENDFELIRDILQDSEDSQYSDSLIRKGLLTFDRDLSPKLNDEEINAPRSSKSAGKDPDPIQIAIQSTQQSNFPEQNQQKIQELLQNSKSQEDLKLNRNFIFGDYINIRLIKKLVRQNRSKIHRSEEKNSEQIHQRGKMILHQIVKN